MVTQSEEIEEEKKNVFKQLTNLNVTYGNKLTWQYKVFWYLYENPDQQFKDIVTHFNQEDSKNNVGRGLEKLRDEGLVVKTPNGKYRVVPPYAKEIGPRLSMEYIMQTQPAMFYPHDPENPRDNADMSLHFLYGFDKDDGVAGRLLAPVVSVFEMLRTLKGLREDDREYNMTSDIRDFLLSQYLARVLFEYVSGYPFSSDQEVISDFFKELIDKLFELGVEKEISSKKVITEDVLTSLHKEIDDICSLPEDETTNITLQAPKSDDVAIFALPSYISHKAVFHIPSELPSWMEKQLEELYHGHFKYYKLLPPAKEILRMAKTVYFVKESVQHEERLSATLYRLATIELGFTDTEIGLMSDLVEEYWDDDFFIHILLKILWYKGLGEIEEWKNKPAGFDKYCSKMRELKDKAEEENPYVWEAKIQANLNEFEDKEIAFMALEYVRGEEIITKAGKEYQRAPPEERIHVE